MNAKTTTLATLTATLCTASLACVLPTKMGEMDPESDEAGMTEEDEDEPDPPDGADGPGWPGEDEPEEPEGGTEGGGEEPERGTEGGGEEPEGGSSGGEDPPGPPEVEGPVPPAIQDCDYGGGYSNNVVRNGLVDGPQLWIAGVYQTHSDHSMGHHPSGEGFVSFGLPGDNVLVLSSYEPVHWTVDLAEGGELGKIVVNGYYLQTVDAPVGIPVEIFGYESEAPPYHFGYELPEDQAFVNWAQGQTGRDMTGFDGCYDATTFVYTLD